MAVSIKQLLSPLDKSAVLADVYALLGRAFGQPLELDPGSPVGGILDTFVGWSVDDIWNPLVLPALQGIFLDYASGPWLTLIADLIYNRPRIEAQPGTQTVTFENRSTLGPVSQAAGTVRIKATLPTSKAVGKTYTTTTALSIAAWIGSGPYPTGTATVRADIAGTGSNADAGDFGGAPIPLVMGPVNCFVKTVAGSIFGIDEETDANLIKRCRDAVSEASDMGPRAEYESIALDPIGAFARRGLVTPTGWGTEPVAVNRVAVYEPGSSVVNVYLASASGPATGDMSTVNSDVWKVYVALLRFVVPPGITCFVYGATAASVDLGNITIILDAASNVAPSDAEATATAGVKNFFKTITIGGTKTMTGASGYVYPDAVIASMWGPGVIDIEMPSFTTPFFVTSSQVPVLRSYLITANAVSQ